MYRGRMIAYALLGALLVLVAFQLPMLPQYLLLRTEIDNRYQAALQLTGLVGDRAIVGELAKLSQKEQLPLLPERVTISPASGVITIAFPDLPATRQGTLTLVPIVRYNDITYPLAEFLALNHRLERKMLFWACSAELIRTRDRALAENAGTLSIDLAPADCR